MKIIAETLKEFDYYIKWRMTYNCNYNCEYCIQYRNDCKSRHNETAYDILSVAQKIADLIKPNTLIELVGGEISVIKEIPQITKMFKEKGAKLKCLTNLSKDYEFYKNFDSLRASFHPSNADLKEFEDKLLALKNAGVEVGAEVVLSPVSTSESNEKKLELAKFCTENKIPITIDNDKYHPQKMTKKPEPKAHHSYLYIDGVKTEKYDLLDEYGLLKTKGSKCYRGVNSILVILDKVSICPTHQNQGFKWYDKPSICTFHSCGDFKCMAFNLERI